MTADVSDFGGFFRGMGGYLQRRALSVKHPVMRRSGVTFDSQLQRWIIVYQVRAKAPIRATSAETFVEAAVLYKEIEGRERARMARALQRRRRATK